MSAKQRLTVKILLFLILTDVLETFVQFCFKKSTLEAEALKVGGFSDGLLFIVTVVRSPFLWLALASVLVLFIIWATLLSKIDLSVAVPVASFSYIMVPLVSVIFLHEHISLTRWLGVCLILAGVIMVSLSARIKAGNNEL